MQTFGVLKYEEKQWVIETEPHIALRLKRVFPKIHSRQIGKLRLADTIENARDLEWFISRYPMQSKDTEFLSARASEHREKETLIAELLSGRHTSLSFPMAFPPRDYQRTAAAIARVNKGLLLADDVGLGKSVAAIAAFIEPEMQPVLIAAHPHLGAQWAGYIDKFSPHLKTHILKKGTPYDIRKNGQIPDVIISSYHKLRGWSETLAKVVKTVVWDECQELRRTESAKYTAAKHIADSVTWRIGLSATPFYNYGYEMFPVMECIAPGALGSESEFETEWCPYQGRIKDPKAFGSYLRDSGIFLRRTRKEVGRELPACSNIPLPIEADLSALERMGAGCDELARIILGEGEAYRGQKMHASGEFDMKMRQATGIAKAPYVAAFVRMLWEQNLDPVVLYGWHREVYSIWQERLADLNPVLYTGTESPVQKERSKQAFIGGEAKVLLISLRAGAGLDGLQQVSSTVVFGELDWSPGVHEQCTGRVNRDGQSNPVFAYYPLADQGSDPIISDVLGVKQSQIEGVRNPQMELVERLQVDPDHVKKLAAAYLKHRSKG